MLKGLPESILQDDDGKVIVEKFVPNIFVNRYKDFGEDTRIKNLSKRNWETLESSIPNLAKISCSEILGAIATGFESTAYHERIASAQALADLCAMVSENQLEDESFEKALDAILTLIGQKYFNDKEKLVECFATLVE